MRANHRRKGIPALLLALALCLACPAPALAAETAKTVQLMKTEGTVTVTNASARAVSVREKMRLYSGYHVATEKASYAWSALDDAKLAKLDASGEMELRKSGSKLEVLVKAGNVFFNVTEPLGEDESMNIRTSTMVMGIRGTCGWISRIDAFTTQVSILEGEVECTVQNPVSGQSETVTVTAGQTAWFVVREPEQPAPDCEVIFEEIMKADPWDPIPGFVLVELAGDAALRDAILQASGVDLTGLTPEAAANCLAEDQAAQAEELARIETAAAGQESHVSAEPVWRDNTAAVSSSDPGAGGGGSGGGSSPSTPTNPTKNVDVTETAGAVQNDLYDGNDVTVAADDNSNIYLIDSDLTIPAGTTLTVDSGLTMVVADTATVTVDGTLNANGDVENNGAITVNSSNSFHISGSFVNKGSLINKSEGRIEAKAGVDNYGGIYCDGSSTLYSSSADGTVRMQGTSSALYLIGGDITNNSTSGPALALEEASQIGQVTFTEKTLMKSKTEGVLTVGETPISVDRFAVTDSGDYHQFSIATCNVTFDANGGSDVQNVKVITGYSVGSAVPTPAWEGYELTGWNTAADNSGTAFTGSTAVTADLTVYAQWKENTSTHTVTLNANGGTLSGDSSISVTHNGTVGANDLSAPTAPTGYTFYGWYTAASGGEKVTGSEAITADVTYYARYTASHDTYTLTFNANGGTGTMKSLTNSESYTLPENGFTAPTGKQFSGWNDPDDLTLYPAGGTYKPTKNTTLYAVWEDITYTVTFIANGGEFTDSPTGESQVSVSVNHGETVTLPTEPSRTGYTFASWNTAADGSSTTFTGSTQVTANTPVYAQWTAITYTVTYNPGRSGTGTVSTDTKFHGTPLTLSDKIFTRTGYTQTGWTTINGSDEADYELGGIYGVDEDITLYPTWGANTYMVTLDANEGDFGDNEKTMTVKIVYGLVMEELEPKRAGCTFAGWNTEADGTGTEITFDGTDVVSDLTVYAQWTINTYTVIFDPNGGMFTDGENSPDLETEVIENVAYDQLVGPSYLLTRQDCTFAGWALSANARVKDMIDPKPTGDTTYYAVWFKNVDCGVDEVNMEDLSNELTGVDVRIMSAAPAGSLTIDSEDTLIVPAGATLFIDEGITFTNNGGIVVESGGRIVGSVTNNGWMLDNNGALEVNSGEAALKYPWQRYNSNIASVTLGNDVTEIARYAFQSCTALTSVTIPDSVTYIGDGAFSGCTALTSVTIPGTVEYIGGDAFSGCRNLTSVTYNGDFEQWTGATTDTSSPVVPVGVLIYMSNGVGKYDYNDDNEIEFSFTPNTP